MAGKDVQRFVCEKPGCPKPTWPEQARHLRPESARTRHVDRYHQGAVRVVWEGEMRHIPRDPVSQKFPCPCGVSTHARREADKIRALCKYDPHPGPNAAIALEVRTDDEDANPGPIDPPQAPRSLRKRKRRAPRSPSPPSATAPCSSRRAGKRRATVPYSHDSSDDEVIIIENPSSLNRGGPGTRGFAGATHISAYGGIEHATGSRPALRKPFEYSEDQGDLERQVKSLAALNLAARREYIESLEEQSLVLLQAAEHNKELTRRVQQMNDKTL